MPRRRRVLVEGRYSGVALFKNSHSVTTGCGPMNIDLVTPDLVDGLVDRYATENLQVALFI